LVEVTNQKRGNLKTTKRNPTETNKIIYIILFVFFFLLFSFFVLFFVTFPAFLLFLTADLLISASFAFNVYLLFIYFIFFFLFTY